MASPSEDVTRILTGEWSPETSPQQLAPLIYDELRGQAERLLAKERAGHTLQPTALVHEAFLRLADSSAVGWRGRGHFFAVAARALRRVLVDHARARDAEKRGGGRRKLMLEAIEDLASPEPVAFDALESALAKLEQFVPRAARVVELRYLSGLTREEIADHAGVSVSTVRDDLRFARAWLQRELLEAPEAGSEPSG